MRSIWRRGSATGSRWSSPVQARCPRPRGPPHRRGQSAWGAPPPSSSIRWRESGRSRRRRSSGSATSTAGSPPSISSTRSTASARPPCRRCDQPYSPERVSGPGGDPTRSGDGRDSRAQPADCRAECCPRGPRPPSYRPCAARAPPAHFAVPGRAGAPRAEFVRGSSSSLLRRRMSIQSRLPPDHSVKRDPDLEGGDRWLREWRFAALVGAIAGLALAPPAPAHPSIRALGALPIAVLALGALRPGNAHRAAAAGWLAVIALAAGLGGLLVGGSRLHAIDAGALQARAGQHASVEGFVSGVPRRNHGEVDVRVNTPAGRVLVVAPEPIGDL